MVEFQRPVNYIKSSNYTIHLLTFSIGQRPHERLRPGRQEYSRGLLDHEAGPHPDPGHVHGQTHQRQVQRWEGARRIKVGSKIEAEWKIVVARLERKGGVYIVHFDHHFSPANKLFIFPLNLHFYPPPPNQTAFCIIYNPGCLWILVFENKHLKECRNYLHELLWYWLGQK